MLVMCVIRHSVMRAVLLYINTCIVVSTLIPVEYVIKH